MAYSTDMLNSYRDQQLAAAQSWYDQSAARLAQQLAEQKAAEEAARQKMMDTTNNYYNGIYANLDKNYQSQLAAAQADFEAAMAQLQKGYDANVGTVNTNTAKGLQQAYINNMMNQKNLGQQLAAMGRSGGASESTLLGLANQYGQNRGTLENTRNEQLNQLALQLAENQAAQTSDYNNVKTGYATDYNNQKNAYQQAQAQAIADWEAESLARMQNYQQNYTNALTSLQQQLAAQQQSIAQYVNEQMMQAQASRMSSKAYSGGSGGSTSGTSNSSSTGYDSVRAQAALDAERRLNNDKKMQAFDKRDSGGSSASKSGSSDLKSLLQYSVHPRVKQANERFNW